MTSWARWLPAVVWALLILGLSTRQDAFFPLGPPGAREDRMFHFYLEIAVHLVQFFVFFLLVARALCSGPWRRGAALAAALGAVLALSVLNELIQAFTPTRMFDAWDMTIDTAGGLLGALWTLGRRPL